MTDDAIEIAAAVHYSFLPESYDDDLLSVETVLRPAETLGGDYCSVFALSESRTLLCVCDAVGHGIASALFASRINTFVLSHALQETTPCDLLVSLNRFLCTRLRIAGMFASFFAVIFDRQKMQIDFAGAGHPPVLHYSAAGQRVTPLHSVTTLLGIETPLVIDCQSSVRRLQPRDKYVLYTDGLIEACDRHGVMYGERRLAGFVARHHQLSSREFNQRLLRELEDYTEGQVRDDMLLMTVTVK